MTHFQDVFIRNLRYYRTKAKYSQLAFSELINITPNYLNAVENGKNFPSPEVVQKICDILNIQPYQLFLEQPEALSSTHSPPEVQQTITRLRQNLLLKFNEAFDDL